jgi:DNA polymerase elongation subunit (family B)
MTGKGILQQDLVISKLLRQDIDKYRSIFPHVSAAIQLSNNNSNGSSGKYPTKGDTIHYIYTNSQHNNPLYIIVPIENLQEEWKTTLDKYDKEK